MAGNLNRVELIGYLGKDPEIRHTNDGKVIANLSLATSERWKDDNHNVQERTEWHRVVVFQKRAGEFIQKYIQKGAYLRIVGQLQTRKWTDDNGVDRWSTEIAVREFGGEVMALEGRREDREAA